MGKIKNWVRIKLKKFLNIEDLENKLDGFSKSTNSELKSLSYSIDYTKSDLNTIHKGLRNDIGHFQDSVNMLHNTVENVVHIGTDVSVNPGYGRSWSVVCVEGKINIVKFIDLDKKEARDIFEFLKHFEAGRHCVDTPYKEFFYEGLFKF